MFGGRTLAEKFGRGGLPDGRVGETWEVSDVEGMNGEVTNGQLRYAGLAVFAGRNILLRWENYH